MKLNETIKATTKALFLAVLTLFAISTANADAVNPIDSISALNSAELDPVSYEASMEKLYKQITAKDEANLRLCKIFAKKGKEYKALKRDDKYYTETVKNCEARVKRYCGGIMSAKQEEKETKETKTTK